MNLKVMPSPKQPSAQHLTHDQLCDLLLHDDLDVHALHGDAVFSAAAAADQLAACQEHLRNCLICSAELDIMRGAVARFQTSSDAFATREFARRPLPESFSSLINASSRNYSAPAFAWAAAALLVACMLPFSLLHLRQNPLLNHPTAAQQAASSNTASAVQAANTDSDAALLDDIDQHLSAAVPEAMQPLANPAATATFADTAPNEPSN